MTTENPWAALDAPAAELSGPAELRKCAFYGRCSTEDNQDPETSRAWQLSRATAAVDGIGEIVADYFDIGWSRSLPWSRRPEGLRVLEALKDPHRGWNVIVVGEGQRCFYESQWTEFASLVKHYGVDVVVPELGGLYRGEMLQDSMMMLLGTQSKNEREVVRNRVREGMAVQARAGRYLGGRPPYGYAVEPYAKHPNPRKAAEGFMLKRLVVDPVAGPVVSRIFRLVLHGQSLREICTTLNAEDIPCPSAHDPVRNPRRSKDGWQVSTVATLLKNRRYTGYGSWGVFRKQETLYDPEMPSRGYVTRLARSGTPPEMSETPSHDGLVSVEDFLRVQAVLQFRGAVGVGTPERATRRGTLPVPLRQVMYCGRCHRLMSAERMNGGTKVRYRCRHDAIPGRDAGTRYDVHQSVVLPLLNEWLLGLFDADHLEATLAAMERVQAPMGEGHDLRRIDLESRLVKAKQKVGRYVEAIGNGASEDAVIEALNTAQQDVRALERQIARAQPKPVQRALREIIDGLDMAAVIENADPADLNALYRALGVVVTCAPNGREGVLRAEISVSREMEKPPTERGPSVTPPVMGGKSVSEGGLEPPCP